MFDVNQSLIRFWEQRFEILKPKKNKKGNRLFTPADVKNLEIIYHLVKERGMTLAGAEKYLKANKAAVERDTELVRRLQEIRSLLVEIREELKETPQGTSVYLAPPTEPSGDESETAAFEPEAEDEIRETFIESPPAWEETLPGSAVPVGKEAVPEERTDRAAESVWNDFSEETDFFSRPEADETPLSEDFSPREQPWRDDTLSLSEESDQEELIDADLSVPFTAQPLFEVEPSAGPALLLEGESQPEESPSAAEASPSAIDTQQSLF